MRSPIRAAARVAGPTPSSRARARSVGGVDVEAQPGRPDIAGQLRHVGRPSPARTPVAGRTPGAAVSKVVPVPAASATKARGCSAASVRAAVSSVARQGRQIADQRGDRVAGPALARACVARLAHGRVQTRLGLHERPASGSRAGRRRGRSSTTSTRPADCGHGEGVGPDRLDQLGMLARIGAGRRQPRLGRRQRLQRQR